MSDNEFVDGVIFKLPHSNAPEFVKGKLSINVSSLAKWIKDNNPGDWINLDLKVSKEGKPYAMLDTWKPDSSKKVEGERVETNEDVSDSLPF